MKGNVRLVLAIVWLPWLPKGTYIPHVAISRNSDWPITSDSEFCNGFPSEIYFQMWFEQRIMTEFLQFG